MADGTVRISFRLLVGILIFIIVLGGVAVGGLTYFGGQESNELVILKASEGPIKIKPEDRGGADPHSTESPAFSVLDKVKEDEEGVEVLRAPVAGVEPPPIEITEGEAETVTEASEALRESPSATAESAAVVDEEREEEVSEIAAAIKDIAGKKPDPGETDTFVAEELPYLAQLVAFKSEERAQTAVARLSEQHKSRLEGMTLSVREWDDFWRVVVTESMSNAEARAFCRKLHSAGQECIVKEKP
jgi:cell division septation protein DedD